MVERRSEMIVHHLEMWVSLCSLEDSTAQPATLARRRRVSWVTWCYVLDHLFTHLKIFGNLQKIFVGILGHALDVDVCWCWRSERWPRTARAEEAADRCGAGVRGRTPLSQSRAGTQLSAEARPITGRQEAALLLITLHHQHRGDHRTMHITHHLVEVGWGNYDRYDWSFI